MEKRTFDLVDDTSHNFTVARIVRQEHEVKPALWRLKVGDDLNVDATKAWQRSR